MAKNDRTEEKCTICGKFSDRMIKNEKYPGRPICLTCFNGFVFNIKTLEEEMGPIVDDMIKGLDNLDKDSR